MSMATSQGCEDPELADAVVATARYFEAGSGKASCALMLARPKIR
jgi:hypothetical protein